MNIFRLSWTLAIAIAVHLSLASCSQTQDCATATEGCPCTERGNACGDGLVCASGLCVRVGTGGATAGTGGVPNTMGGFGGGTMAGGSGVAVGVGGSGGPGAGGGTIDAGTGSNMPGTGGNGDTPDAGGPTWPSWEECRIPPLREVLKACAPVGSCTVSKAVEDIPMNSMFKLHRTRVCFANGVVVDSTVGAAGSWKASKPDGMDCYEAAEYPPSLVFDGPTMPGIECGRGMSGWDWCSADAGMTKFPVAHSMCFVGSALFDGFDFNPDRDCTAVVHPCSP